MAGIDTATSSGAKQSPDLRRRNVPDSEKSQASAPYTTDDDDVKKARPGQVSHSLAHINLSGVAKKFVSSLLHSFMYLPAGNR